jgi:hypothetical protein
MRRLIPNCRVGINSPSAESSPRRSDIGADKEKIMTKVFLAMIASLTMQSAAFAALGPEVATQDYAGFRPSLVLQPQSVAPQAQDHLVRNPNECAGDHAEPVWSGASTILGYACSHNENGG